MMSDGAESSPRIERRDFIKRALALGACCCPGAAYAAQATGPDAGELQRKIRFMQQRMARLIRALDEPTRQRVLETMGRECAKEFGPMLEQYRGRPEAFLAAGRKQWMERTIYDPAKGTIRVVDRANTCTCPFVQPGVTPPDFCACTLGWQKEAYAMILGEPVDAVLESSILGGAGNCAFKITRRA